MPGTEILVLGATDPLGICVLQELLHRNHAIVAYARTLSKIPTDVDDSCPDIEQIIKGEMNDAETLALAVSKCNAVLSLLGPTGLRRPSYTITLDMCRVLFTPMRQHKVKRIYAMSTHSVYIPKDHSSFIRFFLVLMIYIMGQGPYQNIIGTRKLFEEEAKDLDWVLFRVGFIPGGSDETSWRKDREPTAVAGWLGDENFIISVRRGAITN
ncbi:NmrA family protein [Bisporella sp. PMI_857]|nr:NmrA family protein [Bisporella sp. PMI_857]